MLSETLRGEPDGTARSRRVKLEPSPRMKTMMTTHIIQFLKPPLSSLSARTSSSELPETMTLSGSPSPPVLGATFGMPGCRLQSAWKDIRAGLND